MDVPLCSPERPRIAADPPQVGTCSAAVLLSCVDHALQPCESPTQLHPLTPTSGTRAGTVVTLTPATTCTALRYAAAHHVPPGLCAGVTAGADALRSPRGSGQLHVATSNGCLETVNWLTSLPELNVNAIDAFGSTPLEVPPWAPATHRPGNRPHISLLRMFGGTTRTGCAARERGGDRCAAAQAWRAPLV